MFSSSLLVKYEVISFEKKEKETEIISENGILAFCIKVNLSSMFDQIICVRNITHE